MQDTNQALRTKSQAVADFSLNSGARNVKNDVVYYDDTIRWPNWKSTLLVLGICGAFWGSVIYLGLRVFG